MNGSPVVPWLPLLMTLQDCGGDWQEYVDRLWIIFQEQFIETSPLFEGRRCACKRYPEAQGKWATFWHLISSGSVEADRLPDLRRCERIRWPRRMIDRCPDPDIRTWTNTRKGESRIILALPDFSYVVVLADRGQYVILWTAYLVERDHQREKLRKEYENSRIARKS